MTTATPRTRRPRAPKLWATALTTTIIPETFGRLVLGERQHRQGEVILLAATKADAVARLEELGFWRPRVSSVQGVGLSAEHLRDVGVLAQEGDVAVMRRAIDTEPVALARAGETTPRVVGAWRYDRESRNVVFDRISPAVCQDCEWEGPETHRLFVDHIRCPRCRSTEVYVFDPAGDE